MHPEMTPVGRRSRKARSGDSAIPISTVAFGLPTGSRDVEKCDFRGTKLYTAHNLWRDAVKIWRGWVSSRKADNFTALPLLCTCPDEHKHSDGARFDMSKSKSIE